jgi:hypothetical protein
MAPTSGFRAHFIPLKKYEKSSCHIVICSDARGTEDRGSTIRRGDAQSASHSVLGPRGHAGSGQSAQRYNGSTGRNATHLGRRFVATLPTPGPDTPAQARLSWEKWVIVMDEKQVPECFDWLCNVGSYVKVFGRVRMYTLVCVALGETWESDTHYEVRVSDGADRWFPVPAIPIAQSGVHDVLDHLHRFSSTEAATIAAIRAAMNADRGSAEPYYAMLDGHGERYRALEAAIVELEEELFAAD